MQETETKKTELYNKTLVVGHALSGYEYIIDLLFAHGMSPAKPLKKEQIEPTDISLNLLKTHDKDIDTNSYNQLNIDRVWDGLALDLFMSNLDQEWWGWADHNAIYLLDYWKSIDSKISFILVYNHPQHFIYSWIKKNNNSFSINQLEQILNGWINYNRTLLKFYYRNSVRSLLVNTQQVEEDHNNYLQQLHKQLGLLKTHYQSNQQKTIENSLQNRENNSLLLYLIEDLLKEYPIVTDLFEELQSVANIPYKVDHPIKYNIVENILFVLKEEQEKITLQSELEAIKKEYHETLESEKQKSIENEELFAQLMSIQEKLEDSYTNNQKTLEKIESLTKEVSKKNAEIDQLKSEIEAIKKEYDKTLETEQQKSVENEELLTQLMSVQEELEKYYLENKRLKEKEKEKQRYYGAAERIKNQLSYRLGAKMIESSKSFFGIISLPFSLIAVVLEYKRDMKARKGKKLPPIASYADAYDAERVKGHLSYMLGQTMIKTMKHPLGIFILPFKLRSTYQTFKKNKRL